VTPDSNQLTRARERLQARDIGDPLLMAVLNVTPDSFFDGGRFLKEESARERVNALREQGADIIDIGGESSRPGHEPVSAEEQIERIRPALAAASSSHWDSPDTCKPLVSVDTTEPRVAAYALERGTDIVNDVSCLSNVELARVVAGHPAVLVLGHSRGPMQRGLPTHSKYADVIREVMDEWLKACETALSAGLLRERIWFDPGIGFSKGPWHSYEVLRRLDEFGELAAPIVVGPSRKSFIAAVCDVPPCDRLPGTLAACLHAARHGASVLRVHDVSEVRQALRVSCAIHRPEKLLRQGDVERDPRVSAAERRRPARP
jgi:dihydropteroate synthase